MSPTSALRPCRVCHVVGCTAHKRAPWNHDNPAPRITGRPLTRLRARLFARHPLCAICEAAGRVSQATVRDHIIPLREGGTDAEENCQAVCQRCHDLKTAEESKRGRRRGVV